MLTTSPDVLAILCDRITVTVAPRLIAWWARGQVAQTTQQIQAVLDAMQECQRPSEITLGRLDAPVQRMRHTPECVRAPRSAQRKSVVGSFA